MINKKDVRLSVLGLFLMFLAATASAQTPYGSFTQLEYHDITYTGASVEGFCYGGGFIWAISWTGELIKIDPAGSIVSVTDILATNCYGAICYDAGTLWVVSSQDRILPFDINGNSLGPGIDLSGLPAPFSGSSWHIYGMVKDGDGFWLDSFWVPMIFKVDMSGTVVKQFPNSWLEHYQPTIAKLGNKIYKFTENHTPSNSYSLYEAIAIDADTGSVTDSWAYPNTYPRPIGMSLGDDCFWTLEFYNAYDRITIRRLSIPAPSPLPGLPSTQWGDFTITGWSYPPIQPPQIGGLYGFGYDRNNHRFWLGAGYEQLWGIADVGTPISPIYGYWDSHFDAQAGDIAFYGDQMWILENWSSASTDLVARVQIVDGTLQFIEEWPTGMRQAAGLATNGTYFWISGHVDFHTTSDPMNTMRKFDLAGNLIAEWTYPETTNYEDLTWHRGGLWAINMISSSSCEIHKIDVDTGAVLATYQTGWYADPSDYTSGTLASNGDSLLTFAALSSGGIEQYQRNHLRLIEIQLPSDQVSAKVDFNGDGQEDILWRYYGSGAYQGLNLMWLMAKSGSSSPMSLGGSQTAAGKGSLLTGSAPGKVFRSPLEGRVPGSSMPKSSFKTILSGGKAPALKPMQVMRDPLDISRGISPKGRERLRGQDLRSVLTRKDAVDVNRLNSGEVKTAALNLGTEVVFSQVLDTAWEIAGAGDFDGDKDTDILWRYYGTGPYQGLNLVWYMNGTSFGSEAVFSLVSDTNWRIVGTGDFDGDKDMDILWRYYGTGAYQGLNVVWYMNGVSFVSEAVFSQVLDTNWQIVGTGDFDGDTKTDILWRYYGVGAYQGLNVIWYMNNVTLSNEEVFSAVPDTYWRIVNR
jgi:hypothetical protein